MEKSAEVQAKNEWMNALKALFHGEIAFGTDLIRRMEEDLRSYDNKSDLSVNSTARYLLRDEARTLKNALCFFSPNIYLDTRNMARHLAWSRQLAPVQQFSCSRAQVVGRFCWQDNSLSKWHPCSKCWRHVPSWETAHSITAFSSKVKKKLMSHFEFDYLTRL